MRGGLVPPTVARLVGATAIIACVATCRAVQPETLTEADNGKVLTFHPGQQITVTLPSNRTTGYSWNIADSAHGVLRVSGPPQYTQDSLAASDSALAKVGVGGTERWTFRAVESGHDTLRLEYKRPWEQESAPAKTFTIGVTIE